MKTITQILLFNVTILACSAISPISPTPETTNQVLDSKPSSYLLLIKGNNNNNLIRTSIDGTQKDIIQIPNNGFFVDLSTSVSPDGKLITYYTGKADAEPYNLALNILNLVTQETLFVSNLISTEFPNNLKPVIDVRDFPESLDDFIKEFKLIEENAKFSFLNGLHENRWSPDSQKIAFAAQIDGPSTDIYIYELATKSVRRLTSETDYISYTLEWASDGSKIIYASELPGSNESPKFIRVAETAIESPQTPKIIDGGEPWVGYGWISNNSYLIFSSNGAGPSHHFRYINIDSKTTSLFWEGVTSDNFYIDSENNRMFVTPYNYGIPATEAPLLEVSFTGASATFIENDYYPLSIAGFENSFFAIREGVLYTINYDGNINQFLSGVKPGNWLYIPYVSPDKNFVLIASEDGVKLYNKKFQLLSTLDTNTDYINWRPDSEGALISIKNNYYYFSTITGELTFIEVCGDKNYCIPESVWLPIKRQSPLR